MTFASQAQSPAVETDELLLAIAHEHGPVDVIGVWAELERLAAAMPRWPPQDGDLEAHAEALVALLTREGFRRARSISPQDVLLDAVLRSREGHPLLVASIAAAIARRGGMRAAPIRCAEDILVGITDGERALAINPAGECSSPVRQPRWLCPHEVAFHVLGELSELLALQGRIGQAVHATRLRLELPISTQVRELVEHDVAALRARLN